MAAPPTRMLLLDVDPDAAQRLAGSLGPGFEVAIHTTLSAAEADISARPPACALAGPDAVAALRRIAPDVPIVVRWDAGDGGDGALPDGAQDQLDLTASGELVARVTRHAIESKQAELRLADVCLRDALTGLPNRMLFADRIGQAFARLPRSGRKLVLLHLGVDGFKLVNDSLGRAAGDALLVGIAARLQAVLRPSDTVARLHGDEFAILCDGMDPDAGAAELAARALEALAAPFALDGHAHHVAASVGIAEAGPGGDAERLMREADAAMCAAKQRGGGYELYDDALRDRALRRLAQQNELHHALEHGELVLHYQPQVALGGGRPTGVEALVRWAHPERGLVPPGDFIPLAEASGLIVPLGRWVLRAACAQLAAWQRGGGRMAELTMSVNLSARQLAQPDIVADVAAVIAESGVDPKKLCLEITETAVLGDADATRERLHALKALGVMLAIDDFGTGYSALSYLNGFPVDVLKIDRSFIRGMEDGGRARGVVAAVIKLADAMGLTPVAEGVEVEQQAEELRALGCSSAQGFLWSAACEAADVQLLIEAAPAPAGPIRVVVCDDAPAIRALMRSTLEHDGLVEVVGEAGDGEAVVAVVEAMRPDVVLLDLTMPKVDGLAALPRILEVAPWVGVVVVSGRDEDVSARQALALGAERFMAKPAGVAEIRDAVLKLGLRAP